VGELSPITLLTSVLFLFLLGILTWKLRTNNFSSSTAVCAVFAIWLSIGILNLIINIANVLEIDKDTFDQIFIVVSILVIIFCITIKDKQPTSENWLVSITLTILTLIWVFFVTKAGACDFISCDTISHLAHLKQFQLSDKLSFSNYSITSSLPYDVNYLAYAGATYLVLIDVFSRWFDISHESIFYTILPIFSCVTAVLGAYLLGRSFFNRSIRVPTGLMAAAFSAFIFSIYYSVIFAGYPQLWSIGYPSILANFAGIFLFSAFLLVVQNRLTDLTSMSVVFLMTMAVIPLHSGFSIIIGIIIGLLWLITLTHQTFFLRQDLKVNSPVNLAFAVFLLGWFLSAIPKLIAISVFKEQGFPDITMGYEIPLLRETIVGTMFEFNILNSTRLGLLAFVGIGCIYFLITGTGINNKEGFHQVCKVYSVVLFCYLLMFLPYLTEILISIVTFAVLVRLHWFTDLLLLASVASILILFIDKFQKLTNKRRYLWGVLVFLITVIGTNELNNHYQKIELVKGTTTVLTRSKVLAVPQYRNYLKSIPKGSKYLIYNRGKTDGSTKYIELGLINGQLIQPIYVFSEFGKKVNERCAIKANISTSRINQLINDCEPDYIIYWEWPDEPTDPIVKSPLAQLDKKFLLEFKTDQFVTINIYKVFKN